MLKTYTAKAFAENGGNEYQKRYYYSSWNRSSRLPSGQLDLRQQEYHLIDANVLKATVLKNSGGLFWPVPGVQEAGFLPPGFTFDALDNQARARFNGKVRKGSASLGVTLGSWKQSRDMIISRSENLHERLTSVEKRLRKSRIRRTHLDSPADLILEEKFGWEPLFQDMFGALSVIADGTPDPYFVRARARTTMQDVRSGGSNPKITDVWSGHAYVTCSARVSVSNPNLWLLNRLGLINPATVVWDLIPWSFVVNMFVNVNSMISSVTDEVGLSLADIATTRTAVTTLEQTQYSAGSNPFGCFMRRFAKKKDRTVGSLPSVHWDVKIPDLNWDLAVTAAALALQKMKKINNLIRQI